jgi:PAS domain S-box-containing protein
MNYYALLSILTSFFCVLIGTHAFAQDPNRQLSKLFLILTLLEAYLALTEYGLRMAQDFETALFWFKFGCLWPLTVAVSLHFTLVLARQTRLYRSPWMMISLYLPALLFSFLHLMPNHFFGLPTRAYWGWTYRNQSAEPATVARLGMLWILIIIIWGLYLSIRHFLNAKSYRAKQRIRFILIGFLAIFMFDSFSEIVLPAFGIESPELGSLGLLFGNLFVGYGIWKFKLFTLTPEAIALEIVLNMTGAVLVVEPSGRVVYTNVSAEVLFDLKESQLRGRILSSILVTEDNVSILNEILLGKTDAIDRIHDFETTIVIQGEERIPVAISAFNLIKQRAGFLGYVFIVRDIRDRRLAEKALV